MQTIDKKSTTAETLADRFRDAFEEWLSGLDMERPALSEQSKKTLAESMSASMAWRDSILVSAALSNSPEYDEAKLKGFAFHKEHEEWLGRMISGSLKDETLGEDRTVCRRAVGMLFDIVEAIESIDEYDANVRIAADDLNTEYRADERDNLRHLELAHPVIILGKAGLWNGSRTIASVVRFDNIGDIISDSPWTGMEYETWKIDGHDDLRYVGVHHDGVNTCTFRELKTDGHGEKPIEENDLRALLRASRPLGPLVREVYGMPAPAKKHGNH